MHHGQLVPTLTDGVVLLDAHVAADVEPHLAGEDEETARRFGWWPDRSTTQTVTQAFQDWSDDWQHGRPRRAFAIRAAADLRLVGGCELRIDDDDGATGQVNYWTNQQERGHGYATHALRLLVDYARTVKVEHLESHVAADNIASRRVSERAGFVPVGTFVEDRVEMVRHVLRVAP